MKTYSFHKLLTLVLICLSVSACSVPTIVATMTSSTPVPGTAAPTPENSDEIGITADDLTQSVSTEDGVLTALYPTAWSGEVARVNGRLDISNTPGLVNEVGRRTLLPGELAVIAVYATRADVAANLGFSQNFTLLDLAAATSGGVANTASSSTEINGYDAIAQTGEIGANNVLTDAYSITYEVDGVFVTLTTYAAPGMKDDIRGITELLASNLSVDASKLPKPTAQSDS